MELSELVAKVRADESPTRTNALALCDAVERLEAENAELKTKLEKCEAWMDARMDAEDWAAWGDNGDG